MVGEYDYYLNSNPGAAPKSRANKFAAISWEDWLTFNQMPVSISIQVPTLTIHSDGSVFYDYKKRFFGVFHTIIKFCLVQNAHSVPFTTSQSMFLKRLPELLHSLKN